MTTISYPTLIPRPKEYVSGVWSWLTTVDHKKIGTCLLYTSDAADDA